MGESKKEQHSTKKPWIIGGVLVVVGLLAARVIGRFISPSEADNTIDDNAPHILQLLKDEHRYPPFYDKDAQGIRVEGEFDEEGSRQLVIIGIDAQELHAALGSDMQATFAIARCDGEGLWHPMVTDKALIYGIANDQQGEVYAMAAYIGPSILQLLPGYTTGPHFTPFKTSRVLALTNMDGLLYDYPNVPIIDSIG